MKRYQFIYWPRWWDKSLGDIKFHFCFIRGNPLQQPAAFHLIYAWSLWLGCFEIRKWLTAAGRENALKVYIKNN